MTYDIKRALRSVLIGMAVISSMGMANASENPTEQSIGFYSKGKLKTASILDETKSGILKIFPSRNRSFGNKVLLETLEDLGLRWLDKYPDSERIQIGDIAGEDGGKISRHNSHQNGLDVDIVYLRVDKTEQALDMPRYQEKFVINNKITENFDVARNWEFIKMLVETNLINRIFVDKQIKKAFCEMAKLPNETNPESVDVDPSIIDEDEVKILSRLSTWPHHHDHMHVRFQCPVGSTKCIDQAIPALNHGCDRLNQIKIYKKKRRRFKRTLKRNTIRTEVKTTSVSTKNKTASIKK